MAKRKLTITETETLEKIVIRVSALSRCGECTPAGDWLSLYVASEVSGLSTSMICHLVEGRTVHAAHTEDGHLLICSASLREAD